MPHCAAVIRSCADPEAMTCVLRMVDTGGQQGLADLCNEMLACQGLTTPKAEERAFTPSMDCKVSYHCSNQA